MLPWQMLSIQRFIMGTSASVNGFHEASHGGRLFGGRVKCRSNGALLRSGVRNLSFSCEPGHRVPDGIHKGAGVVAQFLFGFLAREVVVAHQIIHTEVKGGQLLLLLQAIRQFLLFSKSEAQLLRFFLTLRPDVIYREMPEKFITIERKNSYELYTIFM